MESGLRANETATESADSYLPCNLFMSHRNYKTPHSDAVRFQKLSDHCATRTECIRVEVQMISIYSRNRKVLSAARPLPAMLAFFVGFVILCASLSSSLVQAQTGGDPIAEFRKIAGELSIARQSGGDENEDRMQKALAYLDSVAVAALNAADGPNLDGVNRNLAGLASHTPPVGENYRLVKLGGAPGVYAMAINFGLGGPAAVRIYAGAAGQYALVARIDHFVQKDFLDSDLELVPVSNSEPVFVTVSGRTDDLSTGAFTAWRFDGNRLAALWNSDLLQQSSYEAEGNGFRLAYCSQVDEDRPSHCLKMSRDLYRFVSGEWNRVESVDLPPSKPAAK